MGQESQAVLDAAYPEQEPFPGKPGEHRWIAHGLDPYHAVNLREALKLIQDTGDWHGSLRAACHIALRDHPEMKPNVAAEDQKAPAYPEEPRGPKTIGKVELYPQQTEGVERGAGEIAELKCRLIAAEQRAEKAERERDESRGELLTRLHERTYERDQVRADRDRLRRELNEAREWAHSNENPAFDKGWAAGQKRANIDLQRECDKLREVLGQIAKATGIARSALDALEKP